MNAGYGGPFVQRTLSTASSDSSPFEERRPSYTGTSNNPYSVPRPFGAPDPGVCFPCGGSYEPRSTMLAAGQRINFNWPTSGTQRPQAFNATGVITGVDMSNPTAPYSMNVDGKHYQLSLDQYSGKFKTGDLQEGGFVPQMEQVDDDAAKRAAEQVLRELKKNGQLSDPYGHISQLASKVAEVCSKENSLLELDVAPDETYAIFGDIHGNFRCLKNLLGYRPKGKAKYLFLGDFVDRGSQQLEVVAYLFAKKVLFPTDWFLVRGNHEDMLQNKRYGFDEECIRRVPNHGATLYQKVNQVFQYLPMAAIVTAPGQKGVFCCHGGIGPDMTGRDSIREIYKPCCSGFDRLLQPWERILRDLTWSDVRDPYDLQVQYQGQKRFDSNGWCRGSARGEDMFIWGPAATDRFLEQMNCQMIIRAHDPAHAPASLKLDHDNRVWTIFSSTPYPISQDTKGCISNEGAVMLLLEGKTGKFSAVKINQYHQLTSIDDHGGQVICDSNYGGMPIFQDGAGNYCFQMPAITQLSRIASNTSEGEDQPPLQRQMSFPKNEGLPKTSFAWRRDLHVLFGNIEQDCVTYLRDGVDGKPLPDRVKDGEVVIVRELSPDGEWAFIWSGTEGGWTRIMYLHQQLLDLSSDDVELVPGLQGKFVLSPGKEVVVGADRSRYPGMCPILAQQSNDAPPNELIPNGTKAIIEELGVDVCTAANVDGASGFQRWARIKGHAGWIPTTDLHVQAQFNERPQVLPFLPLTYRKVVFGFCKPGRPETYSLVTHEGEVTGNTLRDGEVVQIVKEEGLSSTCVEIESSDQKYGWVALANLHVQRDESSLNIGMVLPGAKRGLCAFDPGRILMVGITHKTARQCALRREAGAAHSVGMVMDGEIVEAMAVSENDDWVQVRKRDGSDICGWLPTMSVHTQVV